MTDSTSDDGRYDFILQERLAGRSARSIGKELRCTVGEVDAALDRVLPKIDNAARLRHISLDLQRLDELLKVFLVRATEKADAQAGLLVVKILERKAALLGLDQPVKLDVVSVQPQEGPQGFDRALEVVMRLKHGPDWQPNGGDGAVDTLSDLDDKESRARPRLGHALALQRGILFPRLSRVRQQHQWLAAWPGAHRGAARLALEALEVKAMG